MNRRALGLAIASALTLGSLGSGLARGQRGPTPAAPPPFVVIVHPANPTRTITRRFLADALLKRTTRWSSGEPIRPVDLDIDSPVRRRVTEDVLNRTIPAVRSYWQQMIFSGRAVPPLEVDSDRAAVRYVASHVGAIGYVSGASSTVGVNVVMLR